MGYHDGRTMNVLALVKEGERYIFLYEDNSSKELLNTLGRYAADEELSFNWHDTAILSQRVRRLHEENREISLETKRRISLEKFL